MSGQIVFSVCGMCPVRCPIEVTVSDGRCRLIQGNRQAPGIRGALCTRGGAGIAFAADLERPQFPMLRAGGRGQGRWQRLSWDDALRHAAEKIAMLTAQHGGRSLLWMDTGGPFSDLRQAFVRGLGSPNWFSGEEVQAVNRRHAALSLFGFSDERLVPDLRQARHVVLQGRNLFESVHIQQANDLLDSMHNGGRLTVVDVRATITSGKASRFLMIRPGTDYVLNLAVIHLLLTRKLFNADFAARWIADLDALAHVAAPYTPEYAQSETGIPAARITQLAEELAKAAPRVVWHPGCNSSRYNDSFQTCRSAFIINALLGSIGERGGLRLSMQPEDVGRRSLKRLVDLFPPVTEKRADGVGWKHPLYHGGPGLLHAALAAAGTDDPYPVKACVTYQYDPLSELPEPDKLSAILAKLDFVVSITSSWSQTAWNADLVLPLSPYLERESIIGQIDGIVPAFTMRSRCAPPGCDTRADWEIVCALAKRLKLDPLAFDSVEAIWDYQLSGTRVSAGDLEASGMLALSRRPQSEGLPEAWRFATESGKIEIENNAWKRHGAVTLAPYQSRVSPQPGFFRLTLGGCGLHSGGHTVNNPLLSRQMPENVLWMNQDAAAGLGISNGDRVSVSVQGGSGLIKVKLTGFIHPEAVFMVPGFGRNLPVESRAMGKGLAHNSLMPGGLERIDPTGGGLAMQEHLVTVSKVL